MPERARNDQFTPQSTPELSFITQKHCHTLLTLQFTAVRRAFASLHEAVVIVIEETIGPQNLINVNAIVAGRVFVLCGTVGHH